MPEIKPGLTIGELQRHSQLDLLEVRILLGFALNLSRVQLITQSERTTTSEETALIREIFSRRLQGEPIAYIIGKREFYGLEFNVTPSVLIPRHETELLVEIAIECLPHSGKLLDMGTGSGAIAIAIAHERPDALITALDQSGEALNVARDNAACLLLPAKKMITLLQSDWYEALNKEAIFSVIAANPPYIRQCDAHLQQGDLRFEPQDALTDFNDGFQALRKIVNGAHDYLAPSGWLLMEHGYDQGAAVRDMLFTARFSQVKTWHDLAGLERVTGGAWLAD